MKSIILIAPPAAGKGTQAELLEEKYNIPHISTGDLLRNAIQENKSYSLEIKKMIDNGQFVSDNIVFELLKKRIEKEDCKSGYILDGFPRNITQAELYNQYLSSMDKDLGIAILIDLDKEEAKSRINGRISCQNCGRVYNLNFDKLKPIIEGKCDCCGSDLIKRNDDNEATYEIRYNEYVNDTEPIINYYQDKEILYIVDGNKGKEGIYQQILDILNKYQ